jgi:hypothetical protein
MRHWNRVGRLFQGGRGGLHQHLVALQACPVLLAAQKAMWWMAVHSDPAFVAAIARLLPLVAVVPIGWGAA